MLNLICGVSGSGKTSELYARLRRRAQQGQYSILIVPEQFTSSTEGRLYRALGDGLSGYVESFSFTSLAERILAAEGGVAVRTLTDAGRAVLVRRAMEQLGGHIRYYSRHRRSAAFCQLAAQTIDEFKSAGLTAGRLAELAADCGAQKEKLAELALIFEGYEALLAGAGMDPADRLTLAAQRLEQAFAARRLPDFLAGRSVFIDEFDTFNAPKKRLMGVMLAAMPEVTVALCDDGAPLAQEDLGVFSGAKRVALDLRRLAARQGVQAAPTRLLRQDLRHAAQPTLAAVAALAAWEDADVACPQGGAQGLWLYAALSREEEARAAAAAIRGLMRQGVRCAEIAVVCRDLARYRAAVRYEFRMAGIPLYCDEPTTPEFCAPAAAVRALLALCRGADYGQNIIALAKTGLCALEEAQVCALENYAYTWSPRAAEWRAPFTKSPQGFGAAGRLAQQDGQDLALANAARAVLVEAVEELRRQAVGCTAAQLGRALYFCLEKLGAVEQQAAQVQALRSQQGIPAAEEAAREWNVVMGLLDQMAGLLGAQPVSAAEYEDLFNLLLRTSDLGHIPQALDAVILTSAGKMRLDEPAYVFVLGLAEGEFPCAPAASGLLTHADRDALIARQIELPDRFENRVVREQVCFYKALTAPSKGLWLSWPQGLGLRMAAALEPVVQTLCPPAPAPALQDLAATPAAALDCLGGGALLGEADRAALWQALAWHEQQAVQQPDSGAACSGLALLRRMQAAAPRQVTDLAAMGRLLGSRLALSPSRIERYYTCPYGYFLQYVLGLRPRKKAELSADQSGTLMHWVLQMALDPDPQPGQNPCAGRMPAPFAKLSDQQLAWLAGMLVEEYAARFLPGDTARLRYLLSRLKKSMAGLLCYLRDEQRQSQFAPVACELTIGRGEGALPPQLYRLPNGRTVQLVGTVDRVDEWRQENGVRWVRVVDYKTGTKKFDLREVYCGLDCQMLFYLFSITRDQSGRFTGVQPAGVLYLLADPAPAAADRAAAQQAAEYELDGLVRDEPLLFAAMDAGGSGRYLPFGMQNGRPTAQSAKKRADEAKLGRIQAHLDGLVCGMGQALYQGRVEAQPLVAGRSPCQWCDYSFVCCHEVGIGERTLAQLPPDPFAQSGGQPEQPAEQKAAQAQTAATPNAVQDTHREDTP